MKYKFTLTLLIIFVSQQAFGMDCSEINITIKSQSDVDTFQAKYGSGGTCDRVAGDLIIKNVSHLTNLDGLKNLKEIGGSLEIENNDFGSGSNTTNSLVNISGLSELTSVGGHFYLDNNSQLSECRWVAKLLGWPDGQTDNTTDKAVFANADGCNSISEIYADATAIWGEGSAQRESYSGLWWNPSESGWGITFEHQADIVFAAWYTYDATGEAWWLTGALQETSEGTFSGELIASTGPPFNSEPFDSNQVVRESVGRMVASFSDTNHGTIDYTVNGISQLKQIERIVFASEPALVVERESNDERAVATIFQLGETVAGSLSSLSDVDWFAVDVQTRDMVEVTFDVSTITSSPTYWSVYWYDPNMSVMSGRNIDAPAGLVYEFPAFTAGTYYMRIQVMEPNFYSSGPYKVTLKEAP